ISVYMKIPDVAYHRRPVVAGIAAGRMVHNNMRSPGIIGRGILWGKAGRAPAVSEAYRWLRAVAVGFCLLLSGYFGAFFCRCSGIVQSEDKVGIKRRITLKLYPFKRFGDGCPLESGAAFSSSFCKEIQRLPF